jgi:hypothetical protein
VEEVYSEALQGRTGVQEEMLERATRAANITEDVCSIQRVSGGTSGNRREEGFYRYKWQIQITCPLNYISR